MFEALHVRVRNVLLAFVVHVCGRNVYAKFLPMIASFCGEKKITHQHYFLDL